MSRGVVAFAGSRSFPSAFAGVVESAVASCVRVGDSVAVGCCVGVDALVLGVAPVGSVRCFAAFGVGGVGACSLSAVALVSALPSGSVSWLAGGSLAVPLPARLAARTRAVVASASALFVFFSSPSSRGSLLAARFAVSRGLPVVAFVCGFCPSLLPSLGAGSWSACSVSSGWRWSPAPSVSQLSLF